MVMYANEVETKEKEKLPEIKNQLQHIHNSQYIRINLDLVDQGPHGIVE